MEQAISGTSAATWEEGNAQARSHELKGRGFESRCQHKMEIINEIN